MIEMTLAMAQRAVDAAHSAAHEHHKPYSVAVVDEAGRLVLYSRGDGAGFFTFDTSRAKAMAAASFRRTTLDITDHKELNPLLWYSLPSVVPAQALPSPGGVPIWRDGRVIGAVGIGGGTPEEDHELALVAAAAAVD